AAQLSKLRKNSLMGFRSSFRHHVCREFLARERRRGERERLGVREDLAVDIRRGHLAIFDGIEGLARLTIEQEDMTGLGNLSHRINKPAVAAHVDKAGRRWEIPVPHIVAHTLEVPDALAGLGLEGKHAIGEQIVADPVRTIKVESCRAGGDKYKPSPLIKAHPRPIVGAANVLPRLLWPGFVAKLTRMGDGVEGPSNSSRADIVGADVPGRSRQVLAHNTAQDQEVFVNDSRSGRRDGKRLRVTPKSLAKVDPTGVPKTGNGMAGLRIDRVKIGAGSKENPAVVALLPVRDAAISRLAEDPFALIRVE